MYLTEQEIYSQHEALAQTAAYFEDRADDIAAFFARFTRRRFVFIGCGSSYFTAKSAARLFAQYPRTAATALAGGDYLVRPEAYAGLLEDSIAVILTRSGQTSEIVRAASHIHAHTDCPIVSVCMKREHDLREVAALDLVLDWSFDNSVCQTRTVTNLYTAALLLGAAYAGDMALKEAVGAAIGGNRAFQEQYRPVLEAVAARPWTHAVVLADGAVAGLAEEGALAFTEISMLPGHAFCLLDYRHGPMVLNGENTLTVVLLSGGDPDLQADMVRDLTAKGGTVITVSADPRPPIPVAAHIHADIAGPFAAMGIPLINTVQMLAFAKAIHRGGNPDQPAGLDAFITLPAKGA